MDEVEVSATDIGVYVLNIKKVVLGVFGTDNGG